MRKPTWIVLYNGIWHWWMERAKTSRVSISQAVLVDGGLSPPPSKLYPGRKCYMVTVTMGGVEHSGFGPSPFIARRAAILVASRTHNEPPAPRAPLAVSNGPSQSSRSHPDQQPHSAMPLSFHQPRSPLLHPPLSFSNRPPLLHPPGPSRPPTPLSFHSLGPSRPPTPLPLGPSRPPTPLPLGPSRPPTPLPLGPSRPPTPLPLGPSRPPTPLPFHPPGPSPPRPPTPLPFHPPGPSPPPHLPPLPPGHSPPYPSGNRSPLLFHPPGSPSLHPPCPPNSHLLHPPLPNHIPLLHTPPSLHPRGHVVPNGVISHIPRPPVFPSPPNQPPLPVHPVFSHHSGPMVPFQDHDDSSSDDDDECSHQVSLGLHEVVPSTESIPPRNNHLLHSNVTTSPFSPFEDCGSLSDPLQFTVRLPRKRTPSPSRPPWREFIGAPIKKVNRQLAGTPIHHCKSDEDRPKTLPTHFLLQNGYLESNSEKLHLVDSEVDCAQRVSLGMGCGKMDVCVGLPTEGLL